MCFLVIIQIDKVPNLSKCQWVNSVKLAAMYFPVGLFLTGSVKSDLLVLDVVLYRQYILTNK